MKSFLLLSKAYVFCFLLLGFTQLQSQSNIKLDWAKRIGGIGEDMITSIIKDSSENIYLTGYFQGVVDFDPGPGINNVTCLGKNDVFILKLDPQGNFKWVKIIGGADDEFAVSMSFDESWNLYLLGRFRATTDFDPSPTVFNVTSAGSSMDIFILKLNADGSFAWVRSFGNSFSEDLGNLTVGKTGIYITGTFVANMYIGPFLMKSGGLAAVFICKLNSIGTFIWAKQLAGSGLAYSRSIASDTIGNTYIVGWGGSGIDFDPGLDTFFMNSGFLCKLDVSGNFVWAKPVSGDAIALDGFGNIIIALESQVATPLLNYDINISKFDTSGKSIWTRWIGGPKNDTVLSITTDTSGSIFVTGYVRDSADLDPGIIKQNIRTFGLRDAFILKLSAAGNYIWSTTFGGPGNDASGAMICDNVGNVYYNGTFSSTVDFDPGSAVSNLTSAGGTDIFIMKLKQIGGVGMDRVYENSLSLYPNPAKNSILISGIEIGNTSFIISDIQGRQVLNGVLNEPGINISELLNGLYILELKSAEKIISAKFMKN